MLTYPFMREAFVASFFIALLCGVMGVFVNARGSQFFSHTLSEIGFAGAAFGIFAGISPLSGMLLFTIISSLVIGAVGSRASERQAAISVFSGLFIGLGILFLALAKTQASYATNILFGSIVGINIMNVWTMVILSFVILVIVAFIFRKLQYSSFDNLGARFNVRWNLLISMLFLVLLACSVSITAQIVGSLLIFVLLVVPAAAARFLVHTVKKMMLVSFLLALIGAWVGLYLSYLTNWPVSAFIAILESIFYVMALTYHHFAIDV